jgi:hypothetical protein
MRAQLRNRGGRIRAVVSERHADAGARQLICDQRHLVCGGSHHQAHLGRPGFHALERMPTQEQRRERGYLVGGHQPGAHSQQQRHLRDERDHAQTPQRDRAYAVGGVEHEVHRRRVEPRLGWLRFACSGLDRSLHTVGQLRRGDRVLAGDRQQALARMLATTTQRVVFGEAGLHMLR